MALDLNYLDSILAKDLLAFQQLLAVTKLEQEAIIQNKPQIIDTCILKKTQILLAIEKLENAKTKLLIHIGREFNLNKKLKNFREVADLLGNLYQEKIISYLDNLQKIALELKAVNLNNGKLLNYSLHFINYMVSSFSTMDDTKCTYNAAGIYQKPQRMNKLEYCF